MLVTASVDQIQMASRLQLSQNLIMRGQVVWTGRSSMDICMQLFQARSSPSYDELLYVSRTILELPHDSHHGLAVGQLRWAVATPPHNCGSAAMSYAQFVNEQVEGCVTRCDDLAQARLRSFRECRKATSSTPA